LGNRSGSLLDFPAEAECPASSGVYFAMMGRGSLMRSFLDELFVALAVTTGAIYHLALLIVLARILV
jgi:hypothetical protein